MATKPVFFDVNNIPGHWTFLQKHEEGNWQIDRKNDSIKMRKLQKKQRLRRYRKKFLKKKHSNKKLRNMKGV